MIELVDFFELVAKLRKLFQLSKRTAEKNCIPVHPCPFSRTHSSTSPPLAGGNMYYDITPFHVENLLLWRIALS